MYIVFVVIKMKMLSNIHTCLVFRHLSNIKNQVAAPLKIHNFPYGIINKLWNYDNSDGTQNNTAYFSSVEGAV